MAYFNEDIPTIAFRSLFQKYDIDNDGKLNESELIKLCDEDFGLSYDKSEAYHWLIDKDGDRVISFDEFVHWMKSGEKLQSVTNDTRFYRLTKAIEEFEQYDSNKNGTLCLEEYRQFHFKCGGTEEGLKSSLMYLDKDQNGVISFYEYLKYLNWIDLEKL